MSTVAADFIGGHEDAEDDPDSAENQKGNGEGDLLDGRSIVDGVGRLHHDVLIGNRESVIYIRHFQSVTILQSLEFYVYVFFFFFGVKKNYVGEDKKIARRSGVGSGAWKKLEGGNGFGEKE